MQIPKKEKIITCKEKLLEKEEKYIEHEIKNVDLENIDSNNIAGKKGNNKKKVNL